MSSEDLKIARASAPHNVVIVDTIELNHASFPGPIYLTNQREDFLGTLEPESGSPPVQALFKHAGFSLKLPKIDSGGVQSLNLAISNLDQEVSRHLELALSDPDPIEVYYRPYIYGQWDSPAEIPPRKLTLDSAVVDKFVANGRATTVDWINKKLHKRLYDIEGFPGLRR